MQEIVKSPKLSMVTIVTVTYNSAAIVPALAKVLNQFPHCIVVDNASQDDTVAQLKLLSPHAHVIALDKNIGFGAGNNRGVCAAKTPFVLLLNPDCQIETVAVEILLDCAETYPLALSIAPTTFNPQGNSYSHFKWDFLHAERNHQQYQANDIVGPVSAKAIDGACQLIRVEHFKKIGMYDEALFMYYEEDDLGLRATANGFDMICTPNATAIHIGNASSPNTNHIRFIKNYHPTRSKILMLNKHVNKFTAQRFRWRLLLTGLVLMPLSILLGKKDRVIKQTARWWAAVQTKI